MGGNVLYDTSTARCMKVDVGFREWIGPVDTPLELWVGFMGREYSVKIPLDTVVGSAHLEPEQEFLSNSLTGQRAVLTQVTLTPTQLYYEIRSVGEMRQVTGWDGSLITSSQMDGLGGGKQFNWEEGEFSYATEFKNLLFTDVNEVESIILGDTEFPLDGSEPTLAEENERLYPFYVPYYEWGGNIYTDVEALCQGLGAEYIWDEAVQTVTAAYRDVTIEMTAGSSQVLVNGEPMDLLGDVWDGALQEWVEDSPLPILREDGVLIAPTYLFANGHITGGVWGLDVARLHVDGSRNQDPDRLVVLP